MFLKINLFLFFIFVDMYVRTYPGSEILSRILLTFPKKYHLKKHRIFWKIFAMFLGSKVSQEIVGPRQGGQAGGNIC